jgi:hypothetical protein
MIGVDYLKLTYSQIFKGDSKSTFNGMVRKDHTVPVYFMRNQVWSLAIWRGWLIQ